MSTLFLISRSLSRFRSPQITKPHTAASPCRSNASSSLGTIWQAYSALSFNLCYNFPFGGYNMDQEEFAMVNTDTIYLLQECDAGTKMAAAFIVQRYSEDTSRRPARSRSYNKGTSLSSALAPPLFSFRYPSLCSLSSPA